MKISEIFYSLQGEGTKIGTPSIFIRLDGCNLRCGWCDSPFTSWWHQEVKKIDIKEMYRNIISEFGFVEHVVITGGEPLLSKEITDLCVILRQHGHFITIETNGTIYKANIVCDLFSVSPKLSNSIPSLWNAPHCFRGAVEEVNKARKLHCRNIEKLKLDKFIEHERDCDCEVQFKFVVSSMEDIEEIETIINRFKICKRMVYIMPEGVTEEAQRNNSIIVAEICKTKQWIFCPRLQINLWGDKRGV